MLENAQLITVDADRAAAVVLTRELTLDQPRDQVTDARLRATAHGVYEAQIDGEPVTVIARPSARSTGVTTKSPSQRSGRFIARAR